MKTVTKYLLDIPLPRMIRVRQGFDAKELEDPKGVLLEQLAAEGVAERVKPGMRVGITAGSCGIDNMPLYLRTLCDWVKEQGGQPFIIPAMGSHGGATAEGQRQLLSLYGITEETMGAPILDSIEVVQIDVTEDGVPCYMAKTALEADAIILCNRIKPPYHLPPHLRIRTGQNVRHRPGQARRGIGRPRGRLGRFRPYAGGRLPEALCHGEDHFRRGPVGKRL